MKRPNMSVRAVGSAAMRVAVAVVALFLVGVLSPGGVEGAGFDVDGKVTKQRIDYEGACQPGYLADTAADPEIGANETISEAQPKVIKLQTPGDIEGCLGVEYIPFTLLIDSELFDAANVSTRVTATMGQSATSVQVEACPDFPVSGQLYVGVELMTYGASDCQGGPGVISNISGRTPTQDHPIGSLVRAQGLLKLVARGQPTYAGGPTTGEPAHDAGAPVGSPHAYLTCRARLYQTEAGPVDDVVSRSRCYANLEPGTFWPDDPVSSTMPLLGLAPLVYHDISTGTVDGATGEMVLTTGIEGFNCFPLFDNWLWAQITERTTLSKTPTSTGALEIFVYTNDTCTGTPTLSLGAGDSVSSTEIDPSTDTDGDGCTDFQELGDNVGRGGWRDPFNKWDYFNPEKDLVNRSTDIEVVVNNYRIDYPDPNYSENWDIDGVYLPGPSNWNLGPADGFIRSPDISAAVDSYRHDCKIN